MSAISAEGVWKFFGDFPALRNVSFHARPGECLALLGRNGAGKTTLLRILAGLSRPARGEVTIHGRSTRDEQTRRQIGVLGHGISLYDELSAFENLALFGKLYGLPKAKATAGEWLERIGLDHVRHAKVREFSRGMRQRLAVARSLLHEPAVLLLDEPFTALDDRAVTLLDGMLRDHLAHGRTVILTTHQLREALALATHVALLARGALAHFGERTPKMLEDPGWLYRHYGQSS